MDIKIDDKRGTGVLASFAKAIGAGLSGRYVYIPESRGGGYLAGFSWSNDLRMMIRNYHLNDDIAIEWKNHAIIDQEPVIFQLTGIFSSSGQGHGDVHTEPPNVLICRQAVTSVISMPSKTAFRSITIAAFKPYLQRLFGHLDHPIVRTILEGGTNFAYDINISPGMFRTAEEMLAPAVVDELEPAYYKLKCKELLCIIFSTLVSREPLPNSSIHMADIQAVYAIKHQLQSHLDETPDIQRLAADAGMSDRKLRRLFNQIFGKSVFEYYQWMRMEEAARLLKQGKYTVSEVGYKLGFTNLSHFARVFEEHHGIKPKKYSAVAR